MSNGAAMLACSEFFLDCPRLYLTTIREAKNAEDDLATGSIKVIFVENISIWGVFWRLVSVESVFAKSTYIDTGLSGTGSWLLIK